MLRILGTVSACAMLAACASKNEPQDGGVDLATCVAHGPIGTPRANCPSDLPPDDDCATASPVYDDVAPIFAARCRICHAAGGLETAHLFDTYAQIHDNTMIRADILTQIYNCRMPPSCAPDLSADERKTMLKWFVCGAPASRDAGSD
jgi:uncharacterized membrane protein